MGDTDIHYPTLLLPLFQRKSNYEGIEFPPYSSSSHHTFSDQ